MKLNDAKYIRLILKLDEYLRCSALRAVAISCLCLMMTFQAGLAAPLSPLFLESKVDKTEATIGDLICYHITVNRQKGIVISLPKPGSNLGEFEIQDYQNTGPMEKEGRLIQTITYIIAAYDVGSYIIPAVDLTYKTAGGEEKKISTESIEIKIKSVAPDQATESKDIKAPLEMKINWASYQKIWWGLASVLCFALLLFTVMWYYRKKKFCRTSNSELPQRPAYEIAYEELKNIWEAFLANNQIKEFYLRLSEIIRGYFAKHFGINALEATTEELLEELNHQPQSKSYKSLVISFLNDCDMVKFAKYIPERAQIEEIYHMALQIIEITKINTDIIGQNQGIEIKQEQE